MSFGWSAGDIIAAINLVNKLIHSVSSVGGSREHFQELSSELSGLLRALNEISELTSVRGQIPEIVALKFAACLCDDTLKTFLKKIEPFDESLGASSVKSKIKAVPKMVRWELLVKKEIPELRSYLVAHVGTLNLRLNTAQLNLTAKLRKDSNERHGHVQQSTEAMRGEMATHVQAICEKIATIPQKDTVPKLDALMSIVMNVLKEQNEMMQMFARAIQSLPPPDLYRTWAQAPVMFEDALGRIMPVASEYDMEILVAIIQAKFKTGPGSAKVLSGEWELFNATSGLSPTVIESHSFLLIPGMKLTMAFVVGQYMGSERCARLGCISRRFSVVNGGRERICMTCGSWIRRSTVALPKPLRPLEAESSPIDRVLLSKNSTRSDSKISEGTNDRRFFKNISIYVTELPPTPSRFRDKYIRDYNSGQDQQVNSTKHRDLTAEWVGNKPMEKPGQLSQTQVERAEGTVQGLRERIAQPKKQMFEHQTASQPGRRARTALMWTIPKAVAGFRNRTIATSSRPSGSPRALPLYCEAFSTYRLPVEVLKEYLEARFPCFDLQLGIVDEHYVFNVPQRLEPGDKIEIINLRDRGWDVNQHGRRRSSSPEP